MSAPTFVPLPEFEQVGSTQMLATGLLLAAVHQCGLAALTHTPSPMGFLNELLRRPSDRERPFLLLVVGHPSKDCLVPDIHRKPLHEVATFVEA